jgi:PIN domain nuclease of toxin-antitoxin system
VILLDTRAWLWWANGSSELSDEARRLVDRGLDATLVTRDGRIRAYPHVRTAW